MEPFKQWQADSLQDSHHSQVSGLVAGLPDSAERPMGVSWILISVLCGQLFTHGKVGAIAAKGNELKGRQLANLKCFQNYLM